jgi:hypothetical protein
MHSIGIGFRVFYFQYYTNIAKKNLKIAQEKHKIPHFFWVKIRQNFTEQNTDRGCFEIRKKM